MKMFDYNIDNEQCFEQKRSEVKIESLSEILGKRVTYF